MRRFVARQPILDLRGRVVAYELLYRSGIENFFDPRQCQESASTEVIADSFLLHGLDKLTRGTRAFLNLTRKGLTDGYAHVLPHHKVVLELLETIEPDAEVLKACQRLRQAGYRLALDDFRYDPRFDALLDLVQVIKVDFLHSAAEEREALLERMTRSNAKLLAEKIEDQQTYDQAREEGFTLFQGYFFGRPKVVTAESVAPLRIHYFQLLQQIHQPDLDLEDLESILRREAGLCFKLMRYVNSVFYSLRTPVDSIRRALVILGEREIRKWSTILVMSELAEGKPQELVRHVTQRARFCEMLAPLFDLQSHSESLFLVGLFSRLDSMLDRPLGELLDELPIASEIKTALLGGDNRLTPVYDYVLAYERADWETVAEKTRQLQCSEDEIASLYQDSVAWTQDGAPAPV